MQEILNLFDPQRLADMALAFVPQLVAALAVLFVFWLIVRLSSPSLRALLRHAKLPDALVKLLVDNLYKYAMLIIGVVMAASQLGIDVGAALAGLGVAGIAIGFAAQDSIANTIAGFLIFWDKPFEVGHYISTQDRYGEVTNITMRTTRIRTPDNTYVVIPNRRIIEEALINHSMYGETRVNVPVGVAYKENVSEARSVLLDAAWSVDGVLSDPEPVVVLTELGASSVNLEVRVWVDDADRIKSTFFKTLEASKAALDDAGIEIPFPHLQLHVDEVKEPVWERARQLTAVSAS